MHKQDTQEVWTDTGQGSGPLGITTLMRCLRGCPAEVRHEQANPNTPTRLGTDPKVLFGTLSHRKLEAYYTGHCLLGGTRNHGRRPLVEPVRSLHEQTHMLANVEKTYQYYIARHPRNEWGRIVECELSHPCSERETDRLNNHIYPGYSCKFDLVIKPTLRACAVQRSRYGLDLSPKKYYIVDHKFIGWHYPGWADAYHGSIQQHTYMAAFRALWPRRKLGGAIVNTVTRGKVPEVRRILVQSSEDMLDTCWHAWGLGMARYAQGYPNPEHCFYPTRCPFLATICDRVNEHHGQA